LSAFVHLSQGNESKSGYFQVDREVYTNKGGRLDIVIETDNQIIGIENKLFHHLNNDLADYSQSIDDWSKPRQLDPIKIILSIKKEQATHGFVNITYDELWETIRDSLGNHVTTSSQKWLLYLADFMSTIENLSGGSMELDANDQFFIDNEEKVNALINDRNKFIAKLNSKIRELMEITEKPDECDEQWIYAKSCLVHDFKLSGYSIAFDLNILPKWKLTLFGRNNGSRLYLSELMATPFFKDKQFKEQNSRLIVEEWDLTADLVDIQKGLLNWCDLLIKAEKYKNENKSITQDE